MSDMLPDIPAPPMPQQAGDGQDVFSQIEQASCPFCKVSLETKSRSLSLRTLGRAEVSLEGVVAQECPSCGGVVYQQEALEQIERARMGE